MPVHTIEGIDHRKEFKTANKVPSARMIEPGGSCSSLWLAELQILADHRGADYLSQRSKSAFK
jgi:hypothetical protein